MLVYPWGLQGSLKQERICNVGVSVGLTRGGTLLRVSDEHEANDDKLDLTDCAEFVQSNPELRVVSHPSGSTEIYCS